MSLRTDYRTALANKLRDVANNLGQTFFSTTELNDMLANAPRRCFPFIYQLSEVTGIAPDSFGRLDLTVTVPVVDARTVTRVYLDADDSPVWGWRSRGSKKITGLDANPVGVAPATAGTYTVEYSAPYTMPTDDVTTVTIPDVYFDFVVIAAAIDGFERIAADKVNYRGFRPSGETGTDENEILNALDTLLKAFNDLADQKAMGLPGIGG